MRALIVLVTVIATASSARAQDPDPYPQQPPQPYPAPQPPPYAQPPVQPMPVQLTAHEHELLQRGEITQQQQLGGAVANALIGFGVGQAIQGRYSETGWIFTLGMGASFALMIAGALRTVDNCNSIVQTCESDSQAATMIIGGALGLTVFYIWGIVDAVTGPASHNRRVRELRMRLGIPQPLYTRVVPYVNKARDGGGTAGLLLRF